MAAIASAASASDPRRSLHFSRRHLFVGPYESATVGDLDRDGRLDIVYGPYWFAAPDFAPRAYRPNHTAKEYHHTNSEHVLDVDRDGWPDIVGGGWGEDGLFWYRNPGKGAAERGTPWKMHEPWEARLLARTRGHMEMFALHDFDGDGTPEVHSACYRKNEPLEVWRWTRGPDGQPALSPFVLGVEGGGHGFAFGDVNGDGREDVLTEIGWYERPAGDPFAGPWKLHAETALPHPSCPFAVKDLDGDGRLDILFGRGHDVGLYWWQQQAPKADGTTTWKPHVIDESWTQAHAIALADLDGDGAGGADRRQVHLGPRGRRPRSRRSAGRVLLPMGPGHVAVHPPHDRGARRRRGAGAAVQRGRPERRRPARPDRPERAGAVGVLQRRGYR